MDWPLPEPYPMRARSRQAQDLCPRRRTTRKWREGFSPASNADRFTFQFFGDSGSGRAQIFHGTLDEVWPKVLMLNGRHRRLVVTELRLERYFRERPR
jgi:hypothetical protein